MHVDASAINLRWFTNGRWRTAEVTTDPQDNTLPGGGGEGSSIMPGLAEFLAGTPLLFSPDDNIGVDSLITVELTYVELLPYAFNNVNFHYPNPFSEELHLKLEMPVDLYEDIVIYIYDHSGRLVKSFDIRHNLLFLPFNFTP